MELTIDPPPMPQTQINDLEILDGAFQCLNEECDVKIIENPHTRKIVEGHIQCKKCFKVYCEKCNGDAHWGVRCNYKCSKCHAVNPAASLMVMRHLKWAQKSSNNWCPSTYEKNEFLCGCYDITGGLTLKCQECGSMTCTLCGAQQGCGHLPIGL